MAFSGPLFVVGMPRSGTKLLRELLNNHPDISIPSVETEFLPYWIRNWKSFGDLSQFSIFESFYKKMLPTAYFYHQGHLGNLIDATTWYEMCDGFAPANVFEALVRHDAGVETHSDRIWGDKTPTYLLHLELLKTTYPTSRFIHIIRDVRDYCLSINHAWGKNMLRAAHRWSNSIASARRQSAALGSDYLEIYYEELLSEPERTLNELCRFVERNFPPEMVKLRRPSENLGSTVGRSEIVRDNVRKWKRDLSRDQLIAIESIACDTLRNCGYSLYNEVEQRNLSYVSLKALQIMDGISLIKFRSARSGRHALRSIWNFYKFSSNRH